MTQGWFLDCGADRTFIRGRISTTSSRRVVSPRDLTPEAARVGMFRTRQMLDNAFHGKDPELGFTAEDTFYPERVREDYTFRWHNTFACQKCGKSNGVDREVLTLDTNNHWYCAKHKGIYTKKHTEADVPKLSSQVFTTIMRTYIASTGAIRSGSAPPVWHRNGGTLRDAPISDEHVYVPPDPSVSHGGLGSGQATLDSQVSESGNDAGDEATHQATPEIPSSFRTTRGNPRPRRGRSCEPPSYRRRRTRHVDEWKFALCQPRYANNCAITDPDNGYDISNHDLEWLYRVLRHRDFTGWTRLEHIGHAMTHLLRHGDTRNDDRRNWSCASD